MGLRETWNDLGTGGKIAIGAAVAVALLVVLSIVLVIVAAVLATFVLGLGDSATPDAPAASFGFDEDRQSREVRIVHESGDTIDSDRLTIAVEGQRVPWVDRDGQIRAGDSITVDAGGGDTIRVLYDAEGDASHVLASYTVPE